MADTPAVVATVTTAWGEEIEPGGTQLSQLDSVRVNFSRAMNPLDVATAANWQLFHEGTDVSALIESVIYDAGTAAVSFTIPLRGDGYELIVSGTIHDAGGVPLDGDANGVEGGDYSLSFSVQQYLVGLGPAQPILDVAAFTKVSDLRVAMNEDRGFAIGVTDDWPDYYSTRDVGYYGVVAEVAVQGYSYLQVFDSSASPLSSLLSPGEPHQWPSYARLDGLIHLRDDTYFSIGVEPEHEFSLTAEISPAGLQFASPTDPRFSGIFQFSGNLASSGPTAIASGSRIAMAYSAGQELKFYWPYFYGIAQMGVTTVSTAPQGHQRDVAMAVTEDNATVIAWASREQAVGDYRVSFRSYAERDQAATAVTAVGGAPGSQVAPSVAMAEDGSFTLTWTTEVQGQKRGVFARSYSPTGEPLSDVVELRPATQQLDAAPKVVTDDFSRSLIMWSDSGEIFVQPLTPDAQLLGAPIRWSVADSMRLTGASLAMNSLGDAIVAWSTEADVSLSSIQQAVHVQQLTLGHAPTLDLNGEKAGTGFIAHVQMNGAPAPIVGAEELLLDHPLTHTLSAAKITIEAFLEGDVLAVDTTGTKISAEYASGVLTLSGVDSLANYQRVLRTATMTTTAVRPTSSALDIEFQIDDGYFQTRASAEARMYVPGSSSVVQRLAPYQSQFSDYIGDNWYVSGDKAAYLPGSGPAKYANITSTYRGINAIVIEFAGQHGTITLDDLSFRVGTTPNPADWTAAPAPRKLTIQQSQYNRANQRVGILWKDEAITNTWLEVTVAANANTGLAEPDVFYYGNRVGDTGKNSREGFFDTSSLDAALIYANLGDYLSWKDPFDFTQDGRLTTTDAASVFANLGSLVRLNLTGRAPLVVAREALESSVAVGAVELAIATIQVVAATLPQAEPPPVRELRASEGRQRSAEERVAIAVLDEENIVDIDEESEDVSDTQDAWLAARFTS